MPSMQLCQNNRNNRIIDNGSIMTYNATTGGAICRLQNIENRIIPDVIQVLMPLILRS